MKHRPKDHLILDNPSMVDAVYCAGLAERRSLEGEMAVLKEMIAVKEEELSCKLKLMSVNEDINGEAVQGADYDTSVLKRAWDL